MSQDHPLLPFTRRRAVVKRRHGMKPVLCDIDMDEFDIFVRREVESPGFVRDQRLDRGGSLSVNIHKERTVFEVALPYLRKAGEIGDGDKSLFGRTRIQPMRTGKRSF